MKRAYLIYIVKIAVLAAVYIAAAKFGLSLAFATKQVTLVWPATGIALSALFLFGYRLWPGVLIGAFVANALTAEPLLVALGIAIGNTLEAVVGFYFLDRIMRFHRSLDRIKDVLAFLVFGMLLNTAVSATIGVLSLSFGGLAAWKDFASVWLVWWIGDMMGSAIVVPLILSWFRKDVFRSLSRRWIEAAIFLISLVVISIFVFTFRENLIRNFVIPPLEYIFFPFIIWASLRFAQVGVATASLIISAAAVWGTTMSSGPFAGAFSVEQNLFLLQFFMLVITTASLLLAAAIREERIVKEQLIVSEHGLRMLTEKQKEVARALVHRTEQLEHARAKDEALLASIGEGMIAVNAMGVIIKINRRAENALSITAREAMGRPMHDVLILEDEKGVPISLREHPMTTALAGKKTVSIGCVCVPRGRVKFPVTITASPVFNKELLGGMLIFRDITREKEAERAKNEFVSLASHQLRTPLAAIKWLIDLLMSNKRTSPALQKKLEDVYKSNERLITLVNDLLSVTRIQSGKMLVKKQLHHVQDVMRSAIDILTPLAMESRHVAIHVTIERDIPAFHFDQDLFAEAFKNVLDNATTYAFDGSSIEITLRAEGKNCVVSIHNDGPAIFAEEREKIFTKFYRSEIAKKIKPSGSGLGLFIARSFLEAMGGAIWFESPANADGTGATFHIALPIIH